MGKFIFVFVSLFLASVFQVRAMEAQKKPVLLFVHGFTSTSLEWKEAADYITKKFPNSCHASLVSLGAHAQLDLEELRKSTWKEWGAPIFAEYEQLVKSGHTDISLILSSAAAALVMEHLSTSSSIFHKKGFAPRQIVFVDAFIRAQNAMFEWTPWLKYIPYINRDAEKSDMTEIERSFAFSVRPMDALGQLAELSKIVEERLHMGITLPQDTALKIYTSDQDPVVDPSTNKLILEGFRTSSHQIDNYFMRSDKHVFTRLYGRNQDTISTQDRFNQEQFFVGIIDKVCAGQE